MTIQQWVTNARDSLINNEFLEAVERFYQVELDEIAASVFSYSCDGDLLESESFFRLLSLDEIMFSEECISRDFAMYSILPLADLSDGNYLCYFGALNIWGCYNVVEHTSYNGCLTIEDALSNIGLL